MARLTDTSIRALRYQARTDIKDDVVPGLYLRVGAGDNGSKVWVARFRSGDATRSVTLGRFPAMGLKDARIACEAAKQIPAEFERKSSNTVAEVAVDWIGSRTFQANKTAAARAQTVQTSILPYVGSIEIQDFTRADAKKLLEKYMSEDKPSIARVVKVLLSGVLNHAVELGFVPYSPLAGMKMPAPVERRDRYLSRQEMADFWQYLNTDAASKDPMRRAIRWIVATGQRRSECLFLHKDEIDMAVKRWTIPGNRTKNGKEHVIPLTDWHINLLGEYTETGYCFVNKRGELFNPGALTHHVKDYNELRGIEPSFTPHDLRRTMTTVLAENGVSLENLKRILNHTLGDVTSRHYDQFAYMPQKLATMEKWRDCLMAL